MSQMPSPSLSDAEILRALVHRDGKTRTGANLGCSEMSVYRWLAKGTAPVIYASVKLLREMGATLTAEQVAAWRTHEATDRRQQRKQGRKAS